MNFFNCGKSKTNELEEPLLSYEDAAPWFNSAGVVKGGPVTFTISGLPLTDKEARNVNSWKANANATITGTGEAIFQRYEVEYTHVADGEAAGQKPHMKLICDHVTLFEVALINGKMKVLKGSNSQNEMAMVDMDTGFVKNKYSLFNDIQGKGKPCLSIKSKGLTKGACEFKDERGRTIAKQLSETEVQVGDGVDAFKVFTLFFVEWWNHVTDRCGPTGELMGVGPYALVA